MAAASRACPSKLPRLLLLLLLCLLGLLAPLSTQAARVRRGRPLLNGSAALSLLAAGREARMRERALAEEGRAKANRTASHATTLRTGGATSSATSSATSLPITGAAPGAAAAAAVQAPGRPSVSELLLELPNFQMQVAEPTCFEGDGEARVGCAENCPCRWFERCYPKHVLWQGKGGHDDDDLERIDIGSCNLNLTMLVLLALLIFCTFLAMVFAVRGALFIFAFMNDKTKMDLMRQKTPIRISSQYPRADELVPTLPQRDANSAA